MEQFENSNSLLDDEICDKSVSKGLLSGVDNDVLYSERKTKCQSLMKYLTLNDYAKLNRLASSRGGLINDDFRRKIWPKLLKLDVFPTSPKPSTEVIESHHYYSQVVLDVNRSLKRFPPSIAERQRLSMQDQLVALIMRVLIKHPDLHYYQGYHDICVTFLLVLGEETAFSVVEKLSTTNLRLFMDPTMQRTSEHLEHIYPLIGRISSRLRDFMEKSEVGVMFCLSWIITWYGHVLEDYNTVVRIFDLFLASHAWMPLYLAAAIVIHREDDILKQECDMASVHCFLSRITDDDDLPFEDLVLRAQSLLQKFPPKVLKEDLREEKMRKKQSANKSRGIVSALTNAVKCIVPYAFSSKTLSIVIVVAAVAIYQMYKQYKQMKG